MGKACARLRRLEEGCLPEESVKSAGEVEIEERKHVVIDLCVVIV